MPELYIVIIVGVLGVLVLSIILKKSIKLIVGLIVIILLFGLWGKIKGCEPGIDRGNNKEANYSLFVISTELFGKV